MKQIQNTIIILLCLSIIGFFANFAQNDYGMQVVAYCILIVGICLCLLAVNELQHFKKVGLFFFSLVVLPSFLSFISFNYVPDFAFLFIILILLVLITLFPLIVFKMERKKENKTNFIKYFEYTFLSLLCIGNYMKILHLPGASPLIVLSVFIFTPLIWDLLKQSKGFYKSKEGLFYLLCSLQIVLCIIGFTFKIQHWPWANYFIFSSLIILGIVLFIYLYNLFKGGSNPFKPLFFTRKISVASFGIMLFFLLLRINGLVPKIYSNEFPNTFYELNEKGNNVTIEGKNYQKKADIYRDNYFQFIENKNIKQ
jgi:hypothetical protein